MKPILLLTWFAFIAFFSFGQDISGHNSSADIAFQSPIGAPHPSVSGDDATLASAQSLSRLSAIHYWGEGGDRCQHYRYMKTAGIVMASVGGGLLVTGIALTALAYANPASGYYDAYGYYVTGGPNPGLSALGGLCIGFGIIGAATGIPLAIVGSIKARKYCGGDDPRYRDRSYLELRPQGNGMSLSMKF